MILSGDIMAFGMRLATRSGKMREWPLTTSVSMRPLKNFLCIWTPLWFPNSRHSAKSAARMLVDSGDSG